MPHRTPFRKDFPIFKKRFDVENITYFDSAATTLKPRSVIAAVTKNYEYETANIARGNHFLSEITSIAFEESREKIASFIKAEPHEIVFTYNCTDAINILAFGLNLHPNDELIVSILEHNSNYLPWKARAEVKVANVDKNGVIDLNHLESLITKKTKLISVAYVPNTSGIIQPIKNIVGLAKKHHILTCIDIAQAISHLPIDLWDLDCDFAVFSGHKMFAPSGVGVLYVNKRSQGLLKPFRLGGGTISKVSIQETIMRSFPYSFEGGTPNIEGVIGLGKAVDYIVEKGFVKISKHLSLLEKTFKKAILDTNLLSSVFPISENHVPIFTLSPNNPKTNITYLSQILSDTYKILLRGGMHCAQLIYHNLNSPGGLRASLHIYNSQDDIKVFANALEELKTLLN